MMLAALLCLFLSVGCSSTSPDPGPAPSPPPLPPPGALLLQEIDTGAPGIRLRSALQNPRSPLYLAALHAARPLAAQLGPAPWLAALRHPNPKARIAAARALATLAPDQSPALLQALASEPSPDARIAMLRALANASSAHAAPAYVTALEIGAATDAQGACLALGVSNLEPAHIPYSLISKHLRPPAAAPLRSACAFAIAALPVPQDDSAQQAISQDLAAAMETPTSTATTRLWLLLALLRYPATPTDPLIAAAQSEDWRVASRAFPALAQHQEPEAYLELLEAFVSSVLTHPERLTGGGIHVWSSALAATTPFADSLDSVRDATQSLARAEESWLEAPTPRLAAAHCEIAAWLDRGRRWPKALRACGDGRAPLPLTLRLESQILASQPSDSALRASYLLRMLQRSPEARPFVLDAFTRVRDLALLEPTLRILTRGSPIDIGHATRALAQLAPLLPRDTHPEERDAVASALLTALRRLGSSANVATLLAFLDTAAAFDLLAFAPAAHALALHASPDVRRRALALLDTFPDTPPAPTRPLPEPIPVELLTASHPLRIALTLPDGTVHIELDPDHAPTSAARLRRAVSLGHLQGAMLVPSPAALELRIGDPFTAYPPELPSWIRREPSGQPFERGSVGLVRLGSDSSSLTPFVTFSRRPELDGGPTHIGHVTRGLEHLEGALLGQRVESARMLHGPPR